MVNLVVNFNQLQKRPGLNRVSLSCSLYLSTCYIYVIRSLARNAGVLWPRHVVFGVDFCRVDRLTCCHWYVCCPLSDLLWYLLLTVADVLPSICCWCASLINERLLLFIVFRDKYDCVEYIIILWIWIVFRACDADCWIASRMMCVAEMTSRRFQTAD